MFKKQTNWYLWGVVDAFSIVPLSKNTKSQQSGAEMVLKVGYFHFIFIFENLKKLNAVIQNKLL